MSRQKSSHLFIVIPKNLVTNLEFGEKDIYSIFILSNTPHEEVE